MAENLALSADMIEQIKRLILEPLQVQFNDLKLALKEMEDLYKANAELGKYVQKIEFSRQLCEQDCKRRLTTLENKPEKSESEKALEARVLILEGKPKENRGAFQTWVAIIASIISILLGLKVFGIIG